MMKKTIPIAQPQVEVTRAVQTAEGETYCLVTRGDRQHWVSMTDMATDSKRVIGELAAAGIALVANPAVTDLKNRLQDHPHPDLALVASQPGWLGDAVYVHPNGQVQKGKAVDAEVLVSFVPDAAYGKSGTLQQWRAAMAPFVRRQPFMTFLLAYGFVAPLLAAIRPSIQNPAVEIVGRREAGKSTIAMAVGSIYGGSPEGDIGIGRTANMTAAAFKQLQRKTSDSFMFLDETNIIDKLVEENLKLFFVHTTGDERMSHGNTARQRTIRCALVLTGNQKLADRAKANAELLEAARSRCISIDVGHQVFRGEDVTTEVNLRMLRDIRLASNKSYGTASRAFVSRIIAAREKDGQAFSDGVMALMDKFRAEASNSPNLSDRIMSTIALTYAAGFLALKWKIWPTEKSAIKSACLNVLQEMIQQADNDALFDSPALKRLVNAIKANADQIKTCKTSGRLRNTPGECALGYRINGAEVTRFFFTRPNAQVLLGTTDVADFKALKAQGYLKGENGANRRLDSKTPDYVPIVGRAYEFSIPTALVA